VRNPSDARTGPGEAAPEVPGSFGEFPNRFTETRTVTRLEIQGGSMAQGVETNRGSEKLGAGREHRYARR
jgi:hypothetical protein